jgi:16S rRNA A1518/A1519 N6-dimethyltransferase RsmA/KsgA/DIM1 with predicted DNA glycosylase/AP lyase activity
MAVNAVGTALWLYAGSDPDLLTESLSAATVRFVARLRSAPILVYAIAAVFAPWPVPASIVLVVPPGVFHPAPSVP